MFVENKKSRFYLLITSLVIPLIAVSVWALFAYIDKQNCEKLSGETKQAQAEITRPEITIKNITLKDTEDQKGYELTVNARESKFYYTPNTVECNNVECSVKDQVSEVAQISAHKALVNRNNKVIFLAGPVLGHIKDITISGNNISYDFSSHTLSTHHALTYHHQDFQLSAPSSTLQLKQNRIEMSGGVTSNFTMPDTQQ